MKGIVHSFESLAALDGDGLRYAVFLAGCPLRCVYCHNPDTWDRACGTEYDAEALARKIARYRPYFGERGGVTFSGGEPLLQAEFLKEMMPLLAAGEIGYVIDTSGGVALTDTVKTVLAGAQCVLLDLKFFDDEGYRRYTGRSIEPTLAMLHYLDEIGKRVRIRIVVVPSINDSEEILDRYLSLLQGIRCVERVELLAFHTMGFFKYEKLGIPNPLSDVSAMDLDRKRELQDYVNKKFENMKGF